MTSFLTGVEFDFFPSMLLKDICNNSKKNEEEFRTEVSCNYPHTPFRPIPRNLVDERDSIGNDHIYGRLASTDCA